jgi:hypothetical protein
MAHGALLEGSSDRSLHRALSQRCSLSRSVVAASFRANGLFMFLVAEGGKRPARRLVPLLEFGSHSWEQALAFVMKSSFRYT